MSRSFRYRVATSRPWALLVLLVTGACPGVPRRAERPRVAVEQVAVTAVQVRRLDVVVILHISNPNRHPVTLAAVDWELTLGDAASMRDTPSIRGRTSLQHLLRAGSAALVELTLRIPSSSAARATAREYHIRATLHFGDIFATIDESGALSATAHTAPTARRF